MALHGTDTIAFSMPGGESSGAPRAQPVDLKHLSRQTMGDRALEQEVLGMFARQIETLRESIAVARPTERVRLAHTLKGTARSVGAFALADCAARIEGQPSDAEAVARLRELIDEVRDFVSAISR